MTPAEFRDAVHDTGWSQRELATILDRDERQIRRWASGAFSVPDAVAEWLELQAAFRKAALDSLETFMQQNPPPVKSRRREPSLEGQSNG